MPKKKPTTKRENLNAFCITKGKPGEGCLRVVCADHFEIQDGIAFFYEKKTEDFVDPELIAVIKDWDEISKQDLDILTQKVSKHLESEKANSHP